MSQQLEYYQSGTHVIAAGIALAVLDVAAVSGKFWVRLRYKQPVKADDWLLIPALIVTLGIVVTATYGSVHKGIGAALEVPKDHHGGGGSVATDQVTLARKIQWAFLIMYPLALGSVKASFLFLYKRLFSINAGTKRLLVILTYLVGAWTVAFFFAELFQCDVKFWANWGSTDVFRAECNETMWLLFAVCVSDFIFDLIIITVPIPLIWGLKLSTKRKLAVLSVFLLGAITVIASLLRLRFLVPVLWQQTAPLERFLGITTAIYWGVVESGVAVLVACLPTLQFPLRQGSWKAAFGSTKGTMGNRSGNSSARFLRSGSSGKPTIKVDNTVDVEYESLDSSPILKPTHTRRSNGIRGAEDPHGLEMRSVSSKANVETGYAY